MSIDHSYVINLEDTIKRVVHTSPGSGRIPYEKSNKLLKGTRLGMCNSPTNIRKLWITLTGIQVEYYESPYRSWRPGTKIEFKPYNRLSQLNLTMYEAALQSLSMDAYNIGGDSMISFQGRPLNFMVKPYNLYNVEELYFDYHVATTVGNGVYLSNIANGTEYSGKQVLYRIAVGLDSKHFYTGEFPLLLLENDTGVRCGSTLQVNRKFPRLKYIGMIYNLDKFIKSPLNSSEIASMSGGNNQKGYWLDYNVSKIMRNTVSYIAALRTTGEDCKIEEGVYRFDDEVLIDSFKNKGYKII